MTELRFKGKEFVYNHHLVVPFRPQEMHAGMPNYGEDLKKLARYVRALGAASPATLTAAALARD